MPETEIPPVLRGDIYLIVFDVYVELVEGNLDAVLVKRLLDLFEHSPTLYWLRTSASFIGLPAMQFLLTTHKWVPWVKHTLLITFLISL